MGGLNYAVVSSLGGELPVIMMKLEPTVLRVEWA